MARAIHQASPRRERPFIAVNCGALPPGDVGLLADRLMDRINSESATEPGYRNKKLSVSARNIALRHSWSGNVRELDNTLRRAAIWSGDSVITSDELRDALLPPARDPGSEVLNRPLGNGFSLPDLLAEVAHHLPVTCHRRSRQQQDTSGGVGRACELSDLHQLAIEI